MEKMETRSDSTILLMSKVGSMFVLGLGSLIMGILPLIIGRCRIKRIESQRHVTSSSSISTALTSTANLTVHSCHSSPNQQSLLTSLLLCFGGGVLLFTTFLHLAPEIRESVDNHQSSGQLPQLETLSLAELLFCTGFFFVYFVEEAVHAALNNHPETQETLLYRTVSVRRCNSSGPSVISSNNNNFNHNHHSQHHHHHHHHNHHHHQPVHQSYDASEDRTRNNSATIWRADDDSGRSGTKFASSVFVLAHADSENQLHLQQQQLQEKNVEAVAAQSSLRSLLTVLALSFHAIFEGLAVGLEPSLNSVMYLALAIATHKLVISFCVGMELYVAGASKRTILGYLSVFSMVTPLGIGAGIALGYIKNDSDTLGPTPTILQGMAAGTLLYVVFFEVLARERANEKSGLLQLTAILIGFMLMLGLQITTAHSHDHGHSHGSHSDLSNHSAEASALTSRIDFDYGTALEQVTDKVIGSLTRAMT